MGKSKMLVESVRSESLAFFPSLNLVVGPRWVNLDVGECDNNSNIVRVIVLP